MEREVKIFQMEINIRVNMSQESLMARESIFGQMEILMKDSFKKVQDLVMEY